MGPPLDGAVGRPALGELSGRRSSVALLYVSDSVTAQGQRGGALSAEKVSGRL